MGLFQDYFTDFTTFRLVCFLLAVTCTLILAFTWPALAATNSDHTSEILAVVGSLTGLIILGFAGATIPYFLKRKQQKE